MPLYDLEVAAAISLWVALKRIWFAIISSVSSQYTEHNTQKECLKTAVQLWLLISFYKLFLTEQ